MIDASPEQLYRAWNEPDLLKQWFCPKPWGVAHAELDVRAGGSNLIVMQSPDGELFPNRGVYLNIIPNHIHRPRQSSDALSRPNTALECIR